MISGVIKLNENNFLYFLQVAIEISLNVGMGNVFLTDTDVIEGQIVRIRVMKWDVVT